MSPVQVQKIETAFSYIFTLLCQHLIKSVNVELIKYFTWSFTCFHAVFIVNFSFTRKYLVSCYTFFFCLKHCLKECPSTYQTLYVSPNNRLPLNNNNGLLIDQSNLKFINGKLIVLQRARHSGFF